jgi:hypothetical protein
LLVRIGPSPSLAGDRDRGSLRESRWLRKAGPDQIVPWFLELGE